jgi:hypothetical protein
MIGRTVKNDETIKEKKSKRARKTVKTEEDEMKRKIFLERNRIGKIYKSTGDFVF